jgi:hypothetical protein
MIVKLFPATFLTCAVVLSALASRPVLAAIVVNGDFSQLVNFVGLATGTQTLNPGSAALTGWTVTGRQILVVNSGYYGLATLNGTRFLDLTGASNTAPFGGVSQTIGTTPSTPYRLTFDFGYSSSFGLPASITVGIGLNHRTFTSPAKGVNAWQSLSWDFTATTTRTLLSFTGAGQGVQYIGLANVSVASLAAPTAVPEPATFGTLLAGFSILALAGRRRSCRK